jgi:tetratricopeptide (TPR) repeat protein
MGAVRLFYDWDWAEQEKEFKRAQALAPNYGSAHQLYAAYLETAGRFDEALTEAKLAEEMDPLSAMFATEVGFAYYFARQYDEAIAQFDKTLNLEPNYADAYQYLGQAYEQKKMYPEAIAAFQKGMAQTQREPALIASIGHAYAQSGDRDKAEKTLAELRELSKQRYLSPYLFALVYAGLGDKDQTFAWLERAFQDRASLLIWLGVEPQFDPVRTDPRYEQLIRRIGLQF